MLGYIAIISIVSFLCGQYTFPHNFWLSQLFLALSAGCFIYIMLRLSGEIKNERN